MFFTSINYLILQKIRRLISEEMKQMKCPMISITGEPQDCIEEKCYFWDLDHDKCKWMSTKWKNCFAKNVDIQWHSMEDL